MSNLKEEIKNEEQARSLLLEKSKTEKLKRDLNYQKFKDISFIFMKKLGIVALSLVSLASLIFLILWIYFYCDGKSEASKVMLTIMQLLTGFISLIVGIWGLILAINSNKNKAEIENNLQLNEKRAKTNIKPKIEADINKNSLE